jgi:Flp pilus assembly protein TadG
MSRLRRPDRRGQSLVEFGLILPIFLLMVFGIVDFGRAVFAYSTLNNAAREAARVAVVDQVADHITTRPGRGIQDDRRVRVPEFRLLPGSGRN